ncbi:MAG: exodeoxyribonuclease VII large subunit [Beijerinckiaceae bacterium]|nr:exodeoxyribonuclease VII large subunit [Beijerinckiaceae bacterium]
MTVAKAPASNAAEVTVTELSGALKRTIEDRFGYVRVRGEVSGYRGPHSSGHVYFCLKDAGARIDAVMWKGAFAKLRVRPEEGMEVIATGKITTYPGKSTYQIVVDAIEPAGVGALMALLEDRRRRLAAEGLFDAGRKQLIPYLPRIIGVVTSPTGAVIRDILHRIADRFPRRVIVWPVRVQGETSAAEVARAIEGFNALPEDGPIPRPDVIIVARGGGSLEDLWGFNEEIVVRAAAESYIPLISAVGHETDTTLIDFASDLRAPTPTGAAEMCVPVLADLLTQTAALVLRQRGAGRRLIEARRGELRGLLRALPNGDAVVAVPRQRLDRASERLGQRLSARLREHHLRLGRAAQFLARHSPQAELARRQGRADAAGTNLARLRPQLVARRREALAVLESRLARAFTNRALRAKENTAAAFEKLERLQERLARAVANDSRHRAEKLGGLDKLLASFGYRNVLARGFALVRDSHGHPVRAASAISPGQSLEIEFADGRIGATATGGSPQGAPSEGGQAPKKASARQSADKTSPARSSVAGGQGSLF